MTKTEDNSSVRFNKNKDPENYYREQIMLYTAWRNETRDLLKDFQTYQDRFQVVKDEIKQNRTQYENHIDVLDQAVQDIESEESSNIVAPNAQISGNSIFKCLNYPK